MATVDGNPVVAILAVVALMLAAPAVAHARSRPTIPQAHTAVHIALDDYAELFDGHVIVGPCRPLGAYSVACRARIDGVERHRYRVVITTTAGGDYLVGARTVA